MDEVYTEFLKLHSMLAEAEYYLQNMDLSMFMLYAGMEEASKVKELLINIYKNEKLLSANDSETNTHLYWAIKSFLAKYDFKDENLDTALLFLTIKRFNPSFYQLTYKSLTDPSFQKLNGKDLSTTFQFFNLLFVNHGLLHCIQPYIANLVNLVPIDMMFSQYGFGSLSFYENPPYEYLIKGKLKIISFIQSFSSPSNYIFPKISQIFQVRFGNQFLYPNSFPECGDDGLMLSLIHSCLLKNTNFIDFAYQKYILGINEKDTSIFTKIAEIMPEALPWFAVASIKYIGGDIKTMKEIKSIIKAKNNLTSLASDVIHRIYNDLKLLIVSSQIQKKKLSYSDLTRYSIPYLLKYDFTSEYVGKLLEKSLFSITDSVRNTDFDFIHAYMAISNVLELLMAKTDDYSAYDASLEIMEKDLRKIQDENTLKSTISAIYSCLFIQNEGSFLCVLALAKKILKILVKLSNQDEIHDFLIAVDNIMYRIGYSTISSAFIDRKSLFCQLIGRSQFEAAGKIARNDEKLNKINIIATELSKLKSGQISNSENLNKQENDVVKVESAFSIPQCRNNLAEIVVENEIKALQEKRFENGPKLLDIFGDFDSPAPNYTAFQDFLSLIKNVDVQSKPITEILLDVSNISDISETKKRFMSYGFDIFGFWLNHLDKIKLSDQIISEFSPDYPTECLAIALTQNTSVFPNFENLNIGNVMKNYIKTLNSHEIGLEEIQTLIDKEQFAEALKFINQISNFETRERELFVLLRSSLCSHKFDSSILDDIVYQIDQNEIKKLIESEYQAFRIRAASELRKYEVFPPLALFYITIFNLTSVGEFENPIIGDYIKGCDVQMSIQTIGSQIPFENLINMINEEILDNSFKFICESLINTPNDLSALLQKYPNKISSVFKVLRNNQSFHSTFLRYCPSKYRNLFGTLMNLSEISKNDSDFDFSTQSFQSSIRKLLLEYHGVEMIKNLFPKYVDLCERFPESKKIFNETIQEIIVREISSISVSNISDEMSAKRLILQLLKFPMSEEEREKVDCINQVINLGIFQRFNVNYSFENYPTEKFARNISDLLFKYEFDQEAIQVCSSFGISFEEHAAKRHDITFFLGVADASRFWAQFTTVNEDNIMSSLFFGLCVTDTLVQDILKMNVQSLTAPSFNFLQTVRDLVLKRPKQSQKRQSDLQSFVSYFVRPTNRAIHVLCSCGFLELAVNLLFSLPQDENASKIFIEDVTYPVISRFSINNISNILYQFDPGLSFVQSYILALIDFFKSHSMYCSLLTFLITVNWLEDAAIAATVCFNNSTKHSWKLKYLYNSEELLRQALNIRRGDFQVDDSFPFRPSDLSEAQLSRLMNEVHLHMKMFEITKYSKNQDLITALSTIINDENAENVAILLGLEGYFKLINEICELYTFAKQEIYNKIALKVCELSTEEGVVFVNKAKQSFSSQDFLRLIIKNLLDNLLMSKNQWFKIPLYLNETINDPETRCLLLIDYNFLSDASELATKHKFKKLYPLIAHKASQICADTVLIYMFEKLR